MRPTALLLALLPGLAAASFSDAERARVADYWSAPGRYVAEPGPRTEVRLTAAGSQWLWTMDRARGVGKSATKPTVSPADPKAWDAWVAAKIARDRWFAECAAARADGRPAPTAPDPGDPGLIPLDLAGAFGEPPAFAAAVRPNRHRVFFDDGASYAYLDQVPLAPTSRYFRFPQGVRAAGRRVAEMPNADLCELCDTAGIGESERRVFAAVSLLEGGFEAVNTYDTGYVSVGFIQFACGSKGGGSLGAVLRRMKAGAPDAFESDFRRFGLDVSDAGLLQVATPEGDREGADAAMAIIEDKRLIAVFQRAGERSPFFRVAQLAVAREWYFPADDPVTFPGPQGPVRVRLGDVLRSEAGLATAMDRKVNTGKIEAVVRAIGTVAAAVGADDAGDLAPYERDIVEMSRFRRDFLADASLSQPPPSSGRTFSTVSRGGKPRTKGRTGSRAK